MPEEADERKRHNTTNRYVSDTDLDMKMLLNGEH